MTRCPWAGSDPLYLAYHDLEWGVPVYDDHTLFEFLVLAAAQAEGLATDNPFDHVSSDDTPT